MFPASGVRKNVYVNVVLPGTFHEVLECITKVPALSATSATKIKVVVSPDGEIITVDGKTHPLRRSVAPAKVQRVSVVGVKRSSSMCGDRLAKFQEDHARLRLRTMRVLRVGGKPWKTAGPTMRRVARSRTI